MGEASCQECGAGKYGDDDGCHECPQGWYRTDVNGIDLTKCLQCDQGETSEVGAKSCQSCSIGQYGATAGNCTACPTGQYQSEKKQTTCLTCKNGGIANDGGTSCEKPTYRVKEDCDYNNQYLNNSSPNNQDWECQPCPLGGFCEGNIAWENVQPKYGWWRLANQSTSPPTCLNSEKNKKRTQPNCAFTKCLYVHACHGAKNPGMFTLAKQEDGILYDPADKDSNLTETCNEEDGYSNSCKDEHGNPARCRLCATCIGGNGDVRYKRTGSGTKCKLCPDPMTNKILLGVGCVVMLIGSAVIVYMEITSETSEDETSDAIKKIIVNFLQMVSLAGGLPLEWPNELIFMFDSFATLSSAGTTLMIPDCELTEMRTADAFYLKQIAYTFSVPVVVVACILVWLFLGCCCTKRMKLNKEKIKDYTILSIVLMLFLCYPMLVRLSLSMLKCPKVGQKAYLMAE